MLKHHIQKISLGMKQIPLGFDCDLIAHMAAVESCLKMFEEHYGEIPLGNVIEYISKQIGLSGSDVLQIIFWLANDEKIHFRIDGRPLKAGEVKKVLLERPDTECVVVTNKWVDHGIFQEVRSFYSRIAGNTLSLEAGDQYTFSRLLSKTMKAWKERLIFYRKESERPGFPGKNAITDRLALLQKISERSDPYSLISSFYDHREEILSLSGEISVYQTFYTDYADTWEYVVKTADAVEKLLPDLKRLPDVAFRAERLKRLCLSESPFDRVEEAKKIADSITPHIDRINREKKHQQRHRSLSETNRLIDEMKHHLAACNSSPDEKNRALYTLRTIQKKIYSAVSIEEMRSLEEDAEDAFLLLMEETCR
ncbi:MAG: hypothetical protein R6U50_07180 [Desulfobacterales bacterium]